MIIGFSFTSDNFLTKALLVDLLFPKSRRAVNCTRHIKCAMHMTAPGLSTVSAFNGHHSLRLYTSLTAKGKAKKSINFQTSSIHKKTWGLRRTCMYLNSPVTGVHSSNRPVFFKAEIYRYVFSLARIAKNVLSFHILLNSGLDLVLNIAST